MLSCFNSIEKAFVARKKFEPKSFSPGGPKAQTRETNYSASLRNLCFSLSAFMNALDSYGYYFDTKTYSAISSLQVELRVRALLRTFKNLSADTL